MKNVEISVEFLILIRRSITIFLSTHSPSMHDSPHHLLYDSLPKKGNETLKKAFIRKQTTMEEKKLDAAKMMKNAITKTEETKQFLEENAKKIRNLQTKMVGTKEKIGFYDAEILENNATMSAEVKDAVEQWYEGRESFRTSFWS